MGVTLFRVDSDERITSVFPIMEDDVVDETEVPDKTAPEPGEDTDGA